MRQFLFDAWHYPMLTALTGSTEGRIAEIAEKSVKEAAYQIERSRDLVIRLGDGDETSRARMQAALDELWRFTGELTTPDAVDEELAAKGAAPHLAGIEKLYTEQMRTTFDEATLAIPDHALMQQGGKAGFHSEALGHLLSEMQWLQRAYPGAKW
jgi:ring-1,2-phenylacetyl-CoA epoxidase subunit PaaC